MGQENVPGLPGSIYPLEVHNYESKVRLSQHGLPPGTLKCIDLSMKKRVRFKQGWNYSRQG